MSWGHKCNGKYARIKCVQKLLAFTAKNSFTGADHCCKRICRGQAFIHCFSDTTCLGIFNRMAYLQRSCMCRNCLLSLPETPSQRQISTRGSTAKTKSASKTLIDLVYIGNGIFSCLHYSFIFKYIHLVCRFSQATILKGK